MHFKHFSSLYRPQLVCQRYNTYFLLRVIDTHTHRRDLEMKAVRGITAEEQVSRKLEEEEKSIYLQHRPAARLRPGGQSERAELAGARHQLPVPLL